MTETTPTRIEQLPLEVRQQIDQRCDRFESAWLANQQPRLEDFLDPIPGTTADDLLHELLIVELAYRRGNAEQAVAAPEVLEAHPALHKQLAALLPQLLGVDQDQRAPRTVVDRRPDSDDATQNTVAQGQEDSCAEAALHIRCPHCQSPVELLADTPVEEISCQSCGSAFSLVGHGDRADPEAAHQVARFQLVSRLGMGAFGTVWKARDTELDRTVALKIPRKGQLSRQEVEQFLREARAAAQIKHPHIVPVHEVGRDGETIFIVSDLIHGVSLADWIRQESLSISEATRLCATIAGALDFAHRQGVIHRDLKPSNIMIDQADQPHIMDFGLAKRELGEVTMTVEGQILGTPAYMSPEQARGQTHWTDRRTDIYSLGVILFQLLTGELPFRGSVQQQIQQRILDDAPDPRRLNPHVSIDLATICLKCLERDPNRRYTFAWEVGDELQRCLRGEPILARPVSTIGRLWRWSCRNPALAVAASLTVVLAVAGPLAALLLETQRRKIASQLDDRDQIIAAAEKREKVVTDERDHLVTQLQARTSAGALPEWRRLLITEYLDQRYEDVHDQLQSPSIDLRQQIGAHLGLGLLCEEVGQSKTALEHFTRVADLLDTDRAGVTDNKRREILADCYAHIARIQRAAGDESAARAAALRALELQGVLASERLNLAQSQIDYLDSATDFFELRQLPLSAASNGIQSDGLVELNDLRRQFRKNWPRGADDLYEFACLLTGRRPRPLTEAHERPSAFDNRAVVEQ